MNQQVINRAARWAIFVLALGGFSIETGEFTVMGLLPSVAQSLNITEPQAGNAIASYDVVVVGSPLIAVMAAQMARKHLVTSLKIMFFLGNTGTALVTCYHGLITTRFLTELPHGLILVLHRLLQHNC